MQPLGKKLLRFPGKTNCHPRKPYINWWENLGSIENKALEKRRVIKEIKEELLNEQLSDNRNTRLLCGL